MTHYELLAVFPGTLVETEIPGRHEALQKLIAENSGTELTLLDKGKSRLAYPIKNVQYGYSALVNFAAEPWALPALRIKFDLSGLMLRYMLKSYNPATEEDRLARMAKLTASFAPVATAREETRPEVKAVEAVATEKLPEAEAVSKTTTSEGIDTVQINQQLDKLLDAPIEI